MSDERLLAVKGIINDLRRDIAEIVAPNTEGHASNWRQEEWYFKRDMAIKLEAALAVPAEQAAIRAGKKGMSG